jgi:hypothetical protein
MHNSKFKIQNRPLAMRAGLFVFCILQLALLSACAKAKAADLGPDGPPLAMSAPPPRVITPMETTTTEAPPTPAPEPTAAAPAGTPPPRVARPQPRTEPPAPVAAAPPPPAPTTPPALEVRSVPSAAAAAEEKKVRDVMKRAADDLGRVTWQRLSAEGKEQYDQSKRFNELADQALKDKNFILAMTLAEKAATFAAELAAR